MNEKVNHLINCPQSHIAIDDLKNASDRAIEITYVLHMAIRHEIDSELGGIVREIIPGL